NSLGGFDQNNLMKSLNELKSQVSDPNQAIQQMLNSGKISQAQYNAAAQRAQQIMRMLTPSARR
nr:hypothetical protein [Clostridia bacterium]